MRTLEWCGKVLTIGVWLVLAIIGLPFAVLDWMITTVARRIE